MAFSPEKIALARAAGYSDEEIAAYQQSVVAQLPVKTGQEVAAEYGGFPEEQGFGPQLNIGAGELLTRGEIPAPATAGAAVGRGLPAAALSLLGPVGLAGSTLTQAGLGAGQEALRPGATRESILQQGGASALGNVGGFGAGQIAGRVINAITGAARSIGQKLTLDSGIRQSLGSATGSRAIQQAEAGLARNPITSRPFTAMEARNQAVLGKALNRFLGVSEELPIEEAMSSAYRQSTSAINKAVPDSARIQMPAELAGKYKLISEAGEAIELPSGVALIDGATFKAQRSELTAALKSTKAGVRKRAREAIELLDGAAAGVPGVDQELYRAGRHQYRAWKTAAAGRAVSQDFSRVNETSLLTNLQRSYGQGALRGGQATGFPEVDEMIATARDMVRVRNPVPNSGTPTGQWALPVIADVATTGGLGSVSALAASELSQTGAGFGAATGLMQNPEISARLAAITAAAAAREATRQKR